jgi:S-adenosylmethionine synthetase
VFLDLDEGQFFFRKNGESFGIPVANKDMRDKEYVFFVETAVVGNTIQILNPKAQDPVKLQKEVEAKE